MEDLLELSLAAFAAAFILVVLAEMGDKTQFVAMTFATKYNPYKVIFAIFLATVASFLIVIVVGQLLTTVVPIDIISLAASISFIGFGIWGLREEKANEHINASRFGPIATVAITFFVAELGDKTQLATLSLAAQYQSPLSILFGATLAMIVADGVGIIVGVVLCKRIPQRILRIFSASVFLIFGLIGVYEVLPAKIGLMYTFLILLLIIALSTITMAILIRKQKIKNSEFSPPCDKNSHR